MKPMEFNQSCPTRGGVRHSATVLGFVLDAIGDFGRLVKNISTLAVFFRPLVRTPAKAHFFLLGLLVMASAGCGVHYYNPRTGVEHVWGFGHLQMRVLPPANGIAAVVKSYSIVGAKVGGSQDDYGFSLGYDSRRMIYVSPLDAHFSLQWPDASFFNVRVGTNFPSLPASYNQPVKTNGLKTP